MSAVRAIALVFFANGVVLGSWGARIPAVRDGLALSNAQLSVVLAGVAAGALVAMPLAGAWSARAGSRRPTRVLLAALCVAPVLAVAAPSFALLVLGALVLGAANGGLDVAMNTQAATVERVRGRLLFGRLHAAFSAGGLVGAATGALAAAAGLDVVAHLALVGAAGLAIVLPATGALLAGDATAEHAPTFVRPTRALLALGVLAFCSLMAEGAALDWSAVYVDDDLGASAALAALAYAAFSATMLTGRLASDHLTARFGPGVLLRAGGVVAGGGLALGVAVHTPAAALAGFAFLGAGLSVVIPIVFRAAGARGGAPALAAVSTVGYTGFLAGPPLIGLLAEVTSLGAALALVAALAGTAAVLGSAARTPVPARA